MACAATTLHHSRHQLCEVTMELSSHLAVDDVLRGRGPAVTELNEAPIAASAVSWGAIFAGAVGAAALSLILLMLGVGLGLSSVSPWARNAVEGTGMGAASIGWIILTQLLASALGGFLAGRLRTKWVAVHSDEVYFRDTVHGFLAWAMASLATAALLTSMIASILGTGAQVAAVAASPSRNLGQTAYFVDSLFRPGANVPASVAGASAPDPVLAAAEANRIFQSALVGGKLPEDDLQYLGQVVARYTGLTPQEAQSRVSETFLRSKSSLSQSQATARDVANKARKASAHASLWLFISLLVGAFVASLAATWGGRLRDA